jgi:hypothetical protein
MTVKIDGTEPNVFPAVEGVDVRDAGRNAEVILGTKIEGNLIPVTIKLSYGQAETLADLLEPFRKGGCLPMSRNASRQPAPDRKMRQGGSRRISRSCRS